MPRRRQISRNCDIYTPPHLTFSSSVLALVRSEMALLMRRPRSWRTMAATLVRELRIGLKHVWPSRMRTEEVTVDLDESWLAP